jgi:hypothetical protein
MSVPSVQIKNVPPGVHRILRLRAGRAGQSLQEYLLARLTEHAQQPTLEEVFDRVGGRTGGRVSSEFATGVVRADRDARSR